MAEAGQVHRRHEQHGPTLRVAGLVAQPEPVGRRDAERPEQLLLGERLQVLVDGLLDHIGEERDG
ncbi:MAG: hypothetical protein ACRD0U_12310 [Acidimicrobiales bacterium]